MRKGRNNKRLELFRSEDVRGDESAESSCEEVTGHEPLEKIREDMRWDEWHKLRWDELTQGGLATGCDEKSFKEKLRSMRWGNEKESDLGGDVTGMKMRCQEIAAKAQRACPHSIGTFLLYRLWAFHFWNFRPQLPLMLLVFLDKFPWISANLVLAKGTESQSLDLIFANLPEPFFKTFVGTALPIFTETKYHCWSQVPFIEHIAIEFLLYPPWATSAVIYALKYATWSHKLYSLLRKCQQHGCSGHFIDLHCFTSTFFPRNTHGGAP